MCYPSGQKGKKLCCKIIFPNNANIDNLVISQGKLCYQAVFSDPPSL